MLSPERLVYKRLILDAVVASVISYREGDKTALTQLESYISDLVGNSGLAGRVVEVVKENIDDIPTLIDKVSKLLDEVLQG